VHGFDFNTALAAFSIAVSANCFFTEIFAKRTIHIFNLAFVRRFVFNAALTEAFFAFFALFCASLRPAN
jgi:hypothetical protein